MIQLVGDFMKKYKLNLLHTSDIHGYVMPHTYAKNEPAGVGLAKISKLVENYENRILIDTGDFLQGSALAYYLAETNPNINPLSSVLNHIGYDYFVIGNHDFNYGQDYLINFTKTLNAKALSANLFKDGHMFIPYDIRKLKDGPTIGIIGLTTHFIPNWENPKNIEDISFIHELTSLKKMLKEVQNVDYIIVAYHGGFNKDLETNIQLANETGENSGSDMFSYDIDCLLTGHQHRNLSGIKDGVIYSQPGSYGCQVNKIVVEFEFNEKWTVVKQEVSQIPVTDEYSEGIVSLIESEEKNTQLWLDIAIGELKDGDCLITSQLDARLNKSPLVTLINQAQLEITGADISCTSLGNNVKGFNKNITMRDVISTYVFPNTLFVLEISGHILKEAMEKCATFFKTNGNISISDAYEIPKREYYNYDMFDGVDYTLDIKLPIGKRVVSISKNGIELDLDKTYTIVMNNYRAAGGGNFTMFQNKKIIKTIEKDMVEVLSNYISNKKILTLKKESNIKILY